MEGLTKHQLILLALLVSFVTSIAASIATASLLDQAPPRVTQTIHRVVERTVETVVPSDTPGGETVVTQEKTVIVKEENAITDAIALVSSGIVRLYLTTDAAASDTDETTTAEQASRFRGLGLIVTDRGMLVTSSVSIISGEHALYEAVLADGTRATVSVQSRRPELGIALLSLNVPSTTSLPKAIVLNDDANLRLGQTVLGLGGREATSVGIGIISALSVGEGDRVTQITASVASDVAGMPLVNLFGEVVGFSVGVGAQAFLPASRVESVL